MSTPLLNNTSGLTLENDVFFQLFWEEKRNLTRDLSLSIGVSEILLIRYL